MFEVLGVIGTALLPVLITVLKELLPTILKGIVGKILDPKETKPFDPIEHADTHIDHALHEGELLELGFINKSLIEEHGLDGFTENELDSMLRIME